MHAAKPGYSLLSKTIPFVSMAAMVAFFSSFCAVRKKSTSPTPSPEDKSESNDSDASNDQFAIANNSSPQNRDENEEDPKPSLPLPPGMMNPSVSAPPPPNFKKMRTKSLASFSMSTSKKHILNSASTKKQILTSLSMKVMQAKREKEFKHEDSLWKKRIILGEKCRISHDDDADDDENGNRVPTYYRRVSCSVPVSRQSSFIDEDAIPRADDEEHAKQIEGKK